MCVFAAAAVVVVVVVVVCVCVCVCVQTVSASSVQAPFLSDNYISHYRFLGAMLGKVSPVLCIRLFTA